MEGVSFGPVKSELKEAKNTLEKIDMSKPNFDSIHENMEDLLQEMKKSNIPPVEFVNTKDTLVTYSYDSSLKIVSIPFSR